MKKNKKENLKPMLLPWLFYLIASKFILLFKCGKIKYNVKTFKNRNKKEGCVLLFNHVAMFDHYIITNVCGVKGANYVATRRFTFSKPIRLGFKLIRVIARDQFKTDTASIMKMKRIVSNGGTLILAPQGQLTIDGDPAYIHPSVVKLLKLLKVDVYTIRMTGTYLANPKWNYKCRKYPINVETRLTLSKDDLNKDNDYIYDKVVKDLDVNDREYQKEHMIKIKGDNMAEGLDKFLFICPKCGEKHTITTKGNIISCDKCGYQLKINEYGFFEKINDKLYFEDEAKWRKTQIAYLADLIKENKYHLESLVTLYSTPTNDHTLEKVGYGKLVFTGTEFYYDGSYNDSIIHKDFNLSLLYMLPFEPNVRFNIPDDDGYFEFVPDDKKLVSEFVQAIDAINLNRREKK